MRVHLHHAPITAWCRYHCFGDPVSSLYFHSGLSLQAEGFLTPRHPQFLLLPDLYLYMLASVRNSLVSCSWAILSYFNSRVTLSRPCLVHLRVIQIEDFFETLSSCTTARMLTPLPPFSFQTCSSSPACYCRSIIYQHLQYLVFLIVMTKHLMRSKVTNHKLTEIHSTGDSVHSRGEGMEVGPASVHSGRGIREQKK